MICVSILERVNECKAVLNMHCRGPAAGRVVCVVYSGESTVSCSNNEDGAHAYACTA